MTEITEKENKITRISKVGYLEEPDYDYRKNHSAMVLVKEKGEHITYYSQCDNVSHDLLYDMLSYFEGKKVKVTVEMIED